MNTVQTTAQTDITTPVTIGLQNEIVSPPPQPLELPVVVVVAAVISTVIVATAVVVVFFRRHRKK